MRDVEEKRTKCLNHSEEGLPTSKLSCDMKGQYRRWWVKQLMRVWGGVNEWDKTLRTFLLLLPNHESGQSPSLSTVTSIQSFRSSLIRNLFPTHKTQESFRTLFSALVLCRRIPTPSCRYKCNQFQLYSSPPCSPLSLSPRVFGSSQKSNKKGR